jgi:hypothetical protein
MHFAKYAGPLPPLPSPPNLKILSTASEQSVTMTTIILGSQWGELFRMKSRAALLGNALRGPVGKDRELWNLICSQGTRSTFAQEQQVDTMLGSVK